MSVYAYVQAGGTTSYVRETPNGAHLDFCEHPADAKLFADQAAVTTYLAAHIATTLTVLGGTGTSVKTATHSQNRGDRTV